MQEGIFIKELKNRFLCEVELDGKISTCYVPASCRLSNFGDFSGCKVLLSDNHGKKNKTQKSLYAILYNREYIIVNLKEANRIIGENIHKRLFSYLHARENIKREYWINNYKSDLYLPDTNTIIEIKSVLLFEDSHTITQIHSQRAISQLKCLHQLLKDGYKVYYFFISMNPTITELSLKSQKNEFHKWFGANIKLGMICKAYTIGITDNQAVLKNEIAIKYDRSAEESQSLHLPIGGEDARSTYH